MSVSEAGCRVFNYISLWIAFAPITGRYKIEWTFISESSEQTECVNEVTNVNGRNREHTSDKRWTIARAARDICLILCSSQISLLSPLPISIDALNSEILLHIFVTFQAIFFFDFVLFVKFTCFLNSNVRMKRTTGKYFIIIPWCVLQILLRSFFSVTFVEMHISAACVHFSYRKREEIIEFSNWMKKRKKTDYETRESIDRSSDRDWRGERRPQDAHTEKRININKFIRCEWCGDRIDWRSNVFLLLPVVWIH